MYLLVNNFLSTQTQKGFLPKIPGCLEHLFLTTALKDAKCAVPPSVTWINLKNAFGLVRHSLIQFSLDHHHNIIPTAFKQIIYNNYYNTLIARVITKTFASKPFHYSIGVF